MSMRLEELIYLLKTLQTASQPFLSGCRVVRCLSAPIPLPLRWESYFIFHVFWTYDICRLAEASTERKAFEPIPSQGILGKVPLAGRG